VRNPRGKLIPKLLTTHNAGQYRIGYVPLTLRRFMDGDLSALRGSVYAGGVQSDHPVAACEAAIS
jgi:hypothetical protein